MNLPWLNVALVSFITSVAYIQLFSRYSICPSYLLTFLVFLVIQSFFFELYAVIIWPKLLSPLRKIPGPRDGSFFNGQFQRIIGEPTGVPHQEWLSTVANEGVIYYTSFLNEERLLLASPQALGEVLVTKSDDFEKPPRVRSGIQRILGNGLLLAEGDDHKKQRKDLMPAFSYRHVKDLFPIFWEKSAKLANLITQISRQGGKDIFKDLADAPVIEIANWANRATLDIIGTAGMGQDFNALENPEGELITAYRTAFQPSRQQQILTFLGYVLPGWIIASLPVAHNANVYRAANTIKRVCYQLIRQKKEDIHHENKKQGVDIISVALKSGGFSEESLVNQMMTFLAAGHETTATSLTWAMYELSQHPKSQSRLREEIRLHLPSINSSTELVTAASLDQCQYLYAICSEVLRLHAPVPMTIRQTARRTSIVGHQVPKGIWIIVPIHGINLSEELWGSKAADFDPDRWIGAGKAHNGGADTNYAMLTFLHGPRSCIGQSFAKAEFACLLAALIGRFEIELEDSEYPRKMVIKGGVTSKPKDGLRIRMKAVNGW